MYSLKAYGKPDSDDSQIYGGGPLDKGAGDLLASQGVNLFVSYAWYGPLCDNTTPTKHFNAVFKQPCCPNFFLVSDVELHFFYCLTYGERTRWYGLGVFPNEPRSSDPSQRSRKQ